MIHVSSRGDWGYLEEKGGVQLQATQVLIGRHECMRRVMMAGEEKKKPADACRSYRREAKKTPREKMEGFSQDRQDNPCTSSIDSHQDQ